jgi:hypothetical protein
LDGERDLTGYLNEVDRLASMGIITSEKEIASELQTLSEKNKPENVSLWEWKNQLVKYPF